MKKKSEKPVSAEKVIPSDRELLDAILASVPPDSPEPPEVPDTARGSKKASPHITGNDDFEPKSSQVSHVNSVNNLDKPRRRWKPAVHIPLSDRDLEKLIPRQIPLQYELDLGENLVSNLAITMRKNLLTASSHSVTILLSILLTIKQ